MIIGSDEYGGIARQDRITANADGSGWGQGDGTGFSLRRPSKSTTCRRFI